MGEADAIDGPAGAGAAPAAVLDYAPPVSGRRRAWRRVWRAWPVWLLLLQVGLSIAYGPAAWRRWRLLRLQAACLTAELPRDRPVYENDTAAAAALLAARPGEYRRDQGSALRTDPRWAALAAEIGTATGTVPGVPGRPTAFCHERRTPDGRRRLVVVEHWMEVLVIEPAGAFGGPPTVLAHQRYWRMFGTLSSYTEGLPPSIRVGAGLPDPADASRFTMPFVFYGIAGTYEGRLGDDDRVTIRLLDEPGFAARAKAARARTNVTGTKAVEKMRTPHPKE